MFLSFLGNNPKVLIVLKTVLLKSSSQSDIRAALNENINKSPQRSSKHTLLQPSAILKINAFSFNRLALFNLLLHTDQKLFGGIELNGLSIKITLGIGFQINQVSCLLVIYSNANRRASPFRAQNGLP
ncbi:hypothetical protein BD560DRAFT_490789 [Blakeslea trispora]|nr:hypothetical protein BD560DRAFT_490789 [Blakeslea trispora]